MWPRMRAASGSRSALFRSRSNTPLVTPHVGPTLAVGNGTDFANRPLWTCECDGIPHVDTVSLYGGWQRAAIKQWQGTSTLAGVKIVDLNVVR